MSEQPTRYMILPEAKASVLLKWAKIAGKSELDSKLSQNGREIRRAAFDLSKKEYKTATNAEILTGMINVVADSVVQGIIDYGTARIFVYSLFKAYPILRSEIKEAVKVAILKELEEKDKQMLLEYDRELNSEDERVGGIKPFPDVHYEHEEPPKRKRSVRRRS